MMTDKPAATYCEHHAAYRQFQEKCERFSVWNCVKTKS